MRSSRSQTRSKPEWNVPNHPALTAEVNDDSASRCGEFVQTTDRVPRSQRSRARYQRVFGAGTGGLLLLIAGLSGWDLRHSRGWFQGAQWVDGVVWWQVGIGVGLLLVAVSLARRLPKV